MQGWPRLGKDKFEGISSTTIASRTAMLDERSGSLNFRNRMVDQNHRSARDCRRRFTAQLQVDMIQAEVSLADPRNRATRMPNANRRAIRDIVGGLAVTALGVAFLIGALGLDLGTTHRMGPGYFPLVVAVTAFVIGVLNAVLGSSPAGVPPESVAWQPLVAVLAAIAAFATIVGQFGLVPAVVAAVLLSSLGDRSSRLPGALVLAVVAALGAWLTFRVGLDLQLPAFRLPS